MSKLCRGGTGGAAGSCSDPSPLARAAAVVRLGGDVLDAGDLEPRGLQRADRGLAARARALHEDLDLLHALLDALAGGRVGGHLGGERGRLAGALEAGAAGGLPGDHVAFAVGERDDRVVERRLDVRLADRDVLLDLAAAALGAARSRHYFLPAFFLPATCMRLGPLRVRALVFVF